VTHRQPKNLFQAYKSTKETLCFTANVNKNMFSYICASDLLDFFFCGWWMGAKESEAYMRNTPAAAILFALCFVTIK
jgi:hypothetical protein